MRETTKLRPFIYFVMPKITSRIALEYLSDAAHVGEIFIYRLMDWMWGFLVEDDVFISCYLHPMYCSSHRHGRVSNSVLALRFLHLPTRNKRSSTLNVRLDLLCHKLTSGTNYVCTIVRCLIQLQRGTHRASTDFDRQLREWGTHLNLAS